MAEAQTQDPVAAFKALNESQQRAALGKMSPEAKQSLLGRLKQAPEKPAEPTMAEKHPTAAKALSLIPAATATGMGIAASETGPGAIAAAGVGGMAGKALENQLEEKLGFKEKQTSGATEAGDLLLEGGKQAAFEGGGRAIAAGVGKGVSALRGVKPEVVGETIGGVKVPETIGQSSGKAGGFSQTIEHYLSKTFLGKPLQEVKTAQQTATRQIIANLSKTPDAVPGAMAQNWEKATQQTRIIGDSLYKSIGEQEAKTTAPVAANILKDESLRLPGKARDALAKIAFDPNQEVARSLGFKTTEEAQKRLGDRVWNQLLEKEAAAGHAAKPATVTDALTARSELRDLATNATDRNLGRLYKQAWEQLDKSIDASLTPEQRAVKTEADKLWRRSYIQESITKNMQRWQNVSAPGSQPMVAVDGFVKMVNQLSHNPLVREGGAVVAKPSKMDILFDNPSDAKAMSQLADFLKTKYATMGGPTGISESIARIGVALEALSIPGSVALGHPMAAAVTGGHLASMAAIAKVMADPGGARLISSYFRSTGAGATALATRIAAQAMEQPMPKEPVSHQNY